MRIFGSSFARNCIDIAWLKICDNVTGFAINQNYMLDAWYVNKHLTSFFAIFIESSLSNFAIFVNFFGLEFDFAFGWIILAGFGALLGSRSLVWLHSNKHGRFWILAHVGF